MRQILTIVMVLCSLVWLTAQDVPVRQWTFDGSDDEFMGNVQGVGKPNFADGSKNFGIYLDGVSHHFVPRGVEWTDDFTVSFWIKPTTVEKAQTIFVLEKVAVKTNKTERFVHLFIQDKKLYLKNEKSYMSIIPKDIVEGEWYQVTYQYNGFDATIFWSGEKVFSSSKVTMFNQMAQRQDVLSIGKKFNGANGLEAVLDEIKVFNRPIQQVQILQEVAEKPQTEVIVKKELKIEASKPDDNQGEKLEANLGNPILPKEEKIGEPFPVKEKKPLADEHKKDDFGGRKNNIQHEIYVISPNIEIEVWDYDQFDEDRISVTLNNSPFIGTCCKNRLVQKKRKRETYRFNLLTDQVNYLTFIAEDMGIYDSQNTAAVRLTVDGEQFDDIYKLILTKKQNAVLKLIHVPLNAEKAPLVPEVPDNGKDFYKVVVENEILDALVVNSTTVSVKVKGTDTDRRKIQVNLEDKPIGNPFYVTNNLSRSVLFNLSTQKEKIILIEALELKQGEKCKVELEIIVNDKVIKTYKVDLDKANTLLPMVYVPDSKEKNPQNQRVVVVTDTALIVQIKDNSKVDGDIVTISQDGKTILENYTLTGEFKDLNIKLEPNSENNFVFTPISMGRSSGENTAYVMIWSNGEVIHEFSLRSQDKNKPARLVIVHKENE